MSVQWFKFTSDYDHKWTSGAVTEFKAGMHVPVKDEVVEHALEAKAGEVAPKPDKAPEEGELPRSQPIRHAKPEKRSTRSVASGGYVPGNPLNLPDPSDKNAIRSEPIKESVTSATQTAKQLTKEEK